jgi:hypothetical protein
MRATSSGAICGGGAGTFQDAFGWILDTADLQIRIGKNTLTWTSTSTKYVRIVEA